MGAMKGTTGFVIGAAAGFYLGARLGRDSTPQPVPPSWQAHAASEVELPTAEGVPGMVQRGLRMVSGKLRDSRYELR